MAKPAHRKNDCSEGMIRQVMCASHKYRYLRPVYNYVLFFIHSHASHAPVDFIGHLPRPDDEILRLAALRALMHFCQPAGADLPPSPRVTDLSILYKLTVHQPDPAHRGRTVIESASLPIPR